MTMYDEQGAPMPDDFKEVLRDMLDRILPPVSTGRQLMEQLDAAVNAHIDSVARVTGDSSISFVVAAFALEMLAEAVGHPEWAKGVMDLLTEDMPEPAKSVLLNHSTLSSVFLRLAPREVLEK